MARMSGKNLHLQWIYSGGTANLSGSQRSFENGHEQESADATAGADSYRVFVPTVKTLKPKAEILWEEKSSGSAVIAAVQPGVEGTLYWSPEGTASGKPKWGAYLRVRVSNQSLPYDDVAMLSVEWDNIGTALVSDGVTATW